MKPLNVLLLLALLALPAIAAPRLETKPSDPYFAKFEPLRAPAPKPLLKPGDRLAICGDSITEQKMYSRIMETYLTVCVPELGVTVRQYGWSGETASGFLARMTNDCLRFQPTVATTCYGMNDHGYRRYEDAIGAKYLEKSTAIVRAFKGRGTRMVQGSPGCVGTKNAKDWDEAGVETKNLNLCTLRNIGLEMARTEKVRFADVFWPMLVAGVDGRKRYGPEYAVAGGDGVHPDWAGQLVMAYAFLKSLGLDGNIGTVTVDLKSGKASATRGHEVLLAKRGEVQVRSSRYPFCASGPLDRHNSVRSGMTLVPFGAELNRLMLVCRSATAPRYKVTWGTESKSFTRAQLAKGVNLADEFALNPFSEAFKRVDDAVAAKQAYETRQVKQVLHGAEGKTDMEAAVKRTEAERGPLAASIKSSFTPVSHTILITPES